MTRLYSVSAALLAALLFGAATPFAKQLLGELPSTLLAGLLYLGSGCGLLLFKVIRDRGWRAVNLSASEYRWLAGAILFGGVFAPVLLLVGLTQATAATTALLLNLEAVFTALLAWWLFKENADTRIVSGMLCVVAGGVVLAWPRSTAASSTAGALWIAAACICWAIDNNLTRKVSAGDAVFLAGVKGIIAGTVNTALALSMGALFPDWRIAGAAMTVGLLGYGISLVMFVLALRGLGAARTGAYFSVAPFIGVMVAGLVFGEAMPLAIWIAGGLMSIGVVLHLTEHHVHMHGHSAMVHEHLHTHDEHHGHVHDSQWDGKEPHAHMHEHKPLQHAHPHYPDIHHRHGH